MSIPGMENRTDTVNPATDGSVTPQSVVSYETRPAPSENDRPEFIATGSEIYNIGEVVEFHVVTHGSDNRSCIYHPCSYRIAKLSENGSWQELPVPVEPMMTSFDGPRYRHSCEPVRISTTGWTRGRYRIQYFYYCGISKEFEMREYPVPSYHALIP